ncbi:hypothetical protein [Streptomyces sp. NPDC093568]|uniref:hypothetical protein n=1 Tax=Streptomyces sp. NPDC093568 TaxID=3366041 RepID=UPI0037FB2A6A
MGQDAAQDPIAGAALLPFFLTVKPKLVEDPAATPEGVESFDPLYDCSVAVAYDSAPV